MFFSLFKIKELLTKTAWELIFFILNRENISGSNISGFRLEETKDDLIGKKVGVEAGGYLFNQLSKYDGINIVIFLAGVT